MTRFREPPSTGPRRLASASAVPLLLAALVLACSDSTTEPEPPEVQPRFLFSRTTGADGAAYGLYSMNADGSEFTHVFDMPHAVTGTGDQLSPWALSLSASPDGRHVAFTAANRCHVIDIDGGNQRMVGNDAEGLCTQTPRWSRDGSMIAYASVMDGRGLVYVRDADLTNPRYVTPSPTANHAYDHRPQWLPDGRVAFRHIAATGELGSYDYYAYQTYIAAVGEGAEIFHAEAPLGEFAEPVWSNGGSRVAFVHEERLYARNSDGSNLVPLTDGGNAHLFPKGGSGSAPLRSEANWNDYNPWSPDDQYIAFMREMEGTYALFVTTSDMQRIVQLTDYHPFIAFDGWAPDGRITFTAAGSDPATRSIYLINRDGSGLTPLVDEPGVNNFHALWVPQQTTPAARRIGQSTSMPAMPAAQVVSPYETRP